MGREEGTWECRKNANPAGFRKKALQTGFHKEGVGGGKKREDAKGREGGTDIKKQWEKWWFHCKLGRGIQVRKDVRRLGGREETEGEGKTEGEGFPKQYRG